MKPSVCTLPSNRLDGIVTGAHPISDDSVSRQGQAASRSGPLHPSLALDSTASARATACARGGLTGRRFPTGSARPLLPTASSSRAARRAGAVAEPSTFSPPAANGGRAGVAPPQPGPRGAHALSGARETAARRPGAARTVATIFPAVSNSRGAATGPLPVALADQAPIHASAPWGSRRPGVRRGQETPPTPIAPGHRALYAGRSKESDGMAGGSRGVPAGAVAELAEALPARRVEAPGIFPAHPAPSPRLTRAARQAPAQRGAAFFSAAGTADRLPGAWCPGSGGLQ